MIFDENKNFGILLHDNDVYEPVMRCINAYIQKYGLVVERFWITHPLPESIGDNYFLAFSNEYSKDSEKWADFYQAHLLTDEHWQQYRELYLKKPKLPTYVIPYNERWFDILYKIVEYQVHPLEAVEREREQHAQAKQNQSPKNLGKQEQ